MLNLYFSDILTFCFFFIPLIEVLVGKEFEEDAI